MSFPEESFTMTGQFAFVTFGFPLLSLVASGADLTRET
jgi:hypothetical protein